MVCVLALLTWAVLQFIASTPFLQPLSSTSFWLMLAPLQNHHGGMITVICLGLVMQIFLTDIYYFRGGFGDNHHLMVCIWFLLILCCGGFVSELSPVWLSNLILAVIISLNFDYENNAVIIDSPTTQQLSDMFDRDKSKSFKLTPQTWKEFRNGWKRFVGWFAHLLTPVL